jgi:hypothetical protein
MAGSRDEPKTWKVFWRKLSFLQKNFYRKIIERKNM